MNERTNKGDFEGKFTKRRYNRGPAGPTPRSQPDGPSVRERRRRYPTHPLRHSMTAWPDHIAGT
jgi:hypothetical protein